jgi:hypothetical protein
VSCASPHPERPDVLCDKDEPCYGYHASAQAQAVWPGTALPETPARTRKGALALIAQRAQR